MRGLSFGKGVMQAMRADTLSIVAFQIGMSIWAVLAYFVLFASPHLKVNEAVFWFMMQIGLIVGFLYLLPGEHLSREVRLERKMPQYKHEMKEQTQEQARQLRAV